MRVAVSERRRALADAPARLRAALREPSHRARLRLSELSPRLAQAVAARLASAKARLAAPEAKLGSLNPLSVLDRGYALVRSPSGEVLDRAARLAPGAAFEAVFRDGAVPHPEAPPARKAGGPGTTAPILRRRRGARRGA